MRARARAHTAGALPAALLTLTVLAGLLAALLLGGPASAQPTQGSSTSNCPDSNPPNELVLAGGTPQTAKLNAPFASPFQVTLANSDGCAITTAVAGTTVTFAAPSSGASGTFSASGSSSLTVGTDDSGGASASGFEANDIAGSYTLTATSAYGSVSFSLTNTAADIAATITPQTPRSEAAVVDGSYGHPLTALVLDANGNPVEGATVTFALGSSAAASASGASGSAAATFVTGQTEASATTDSAGIATSPPFSANGTAGAFTASATTAGVSGAAVFTLDNLAAKPLTIGVEAASRSAVVGSRFGRPLEVTVRSGGGKPIEGATVTFTLGAGAGGSGASGSAGASFATGNPTATETTNAAGEAVSPPLIANTVAGAFTATAAVQATNEVATFALRNLAGRPATITPGAAQSEETNVSSRFPVPLAVTVKDKDGNPVAGVVVTFSAPASGASGRFATHDRVGLRVVRVRTDADGVAVAAPFSANRKTGGYIVTATVPGAGAAAFALVNEPPGP